MINTLKNITIDELKLPIQLVKWSMFNKENLIEKKIYNRSIVNSYHYNSNSIMILFIGYLIRQNLHAKECFQSFNRKTFISEGQLLGFKKISLKSIWLNGYTKDKSFFIDNKLINEKDEICYIKNKNIKYHLYVKKELFGIVTGLNQFKRFVSSMFSITNTIISDKNLYLSELNEIKNNENLFENEKIKKSNEVFFSKIKSKSYATIARETGNCRNVSIRRIKKYKNDINKLTKKNTFKIINRFEKINGQIARKTNIYKIEGVKQVRNKNYKNLEEPIPKNVFFINLKSIKYKLKKLYLGFKTYNQEKLSIKKSVYYKIYQNIKKGLIVYNENIKQKAKQEINEKVKNIKFQKIKYLNGSDYQFL